MIVVVGADRPPLLAEGHDCRRFHVTHLGGSLADGLAALGGRLADDDGSGDAVVPVAWVRANASAPGEALDAMLAHAAANGWLVDDGAAIRAHVEPV